MRKLFLILLMCTVGHAAVSESLYCRVWQNFEKEEGKQFSTTRYLGYAEIPLSHLNEVASSKVPLSEDGYRFFMRSEREGNFNLGFVLGARFNSISMPAYVVKNLEPQHDIVLRESPIDRDAQTEFTAVCNKIRPLSSR